MQSPHQLMLSMWPGVHSVLMTSHSQMAARARAQVATIHAPSAEAGRPEQRPGQMWGGDRTAEAVGMKWQPSQTGAWSFRPMPPSLHCELGTGLGAGTSWTEGPRASPPVRERAGRRKQTAPTTADNSRVAWPHPHPGKEPHVSSGRLPRPTQTMLAPSSREEDTLFHQAGLGTHAPTCPAASPPRTGGQDT